jgi:hypothetical protein
VLKVDFDSFQESATERRIPKAPMKLKIAESECCICSKEAHFSRFRFSNHQIVSALSEISGNGG